jgi:hypothetical protein
MVDFFTYFIENEKKNIRAQAAESVDKACSSMDKCLQNLIATSEDWLRVRKSGEHVSGEITFTCENFQNGI